jgi:hypothetical protein
VTAFTTSLGENSSATGTQLSETFYSNTTLTPPPNVEYWYYANPSTATVTLNSGAPTMNLSLDVTADGTDGVSLQITGVPLIQTGLTTYSFATELPVTGSFTYTLWLTGTVSVNKAGTAASVNGSFYRISGTTLSGQPIAWGKNGPTGGGGDIEGQFQTL